jgi:RecG-like helicase
MAPTEFLARQQYIRFSAFLEHLDEKSRPQVALLTSSVPAVKARLIRKVRLCLDSP